MSDAGRTLRDLARALLEAEREEEDPDPAVTACRLVLEKMYGELETLVGRGGFHALLVRAVAVAGREHAVLRNVEIDGSSPPGLTRLCEALGAGGPDEDVEAAAVTLVAELLGLLRRYLGRSLTVRVLRAPWPETEPAPDPTAGGGGDG